ncbi:MAG: hypothetical protein B7Y31_13060 [Novosphingobium sp. 16-62-11]|uniref:hypothetical protein n=1 Tax=Novosphingobium sp. 17-62-19 TaxID=1970406 RepID=UPI000BC5B608|nr:hypothetical protein [Novosphingobium sp. 17-62-19]OYZ28448.1 MAG: hypothetical protein B7Y31_13060 [Novosphingobium sp. 16-62-11]OZA18531.1 MAG: hypothetical protein B7X90_12000 [Novosphingobium sp. 17-62-19]OZA57974.1 MAG: hypothetical protein B7X78_09140 [Sphingomonadales bacterium 39-62-4]HQS97502.1 hypothetical protein [Novosphingobium sp.]
MNTTIRAEAADAASFWSDHATVLRREAADGVFHGLATLHSGSFADMVRMVARMPEAERATLVIEKAGDRQYSPAEIMALHARADMPA